MFKKTGVATCLLLAGCYGQSTYSAANLGGSAVQLEPAVLLADGIHTSTVLVTIRQSDGTPIPGLHVQLVADGADLTQPLQVTDANGVTRAAISSTVPGKYTVNAAAIIDTTSFALTPNATVLFTAPPQTLLAGAAAPLQVVASNAQGLPNITYTGTVVFSSSDSNATLPPPYTFTAADGGAATLPAAVIFHTAGPQTITATDAATGAVVAVMTFDVQAGDAALLQLATLPSTTQAGAPLQVFVKAYDAYGNAAANYGGTVVLMSTDGNAQLPKPYLFTAANAGISQPLAVIFRTVGTQTLAAVDAIDSNLNGAPQTTLVVAGDVAGFRLLGPALATAGVGVSVQVQAVDAQGNVSADYTGSVVWSSGDSQALLPTLYTFTSTDAGSKTFGGIVLKTAGSQTLVASDVQTAGRITGQTNVTINALSATALRVQFAGPALAAGQLGSVTVTATDAYDNTAPSYAGTVLIACSDANAVYPARAVFSSLSDGVAILPVTFATAGTQTCTATDINVPAVHGTGSIAVQPGGLAGLHVQLPGSVVAGTNFNAVLQAVDGYGNTVSSFTGAVALTSDDTHAVFPASVALTASNAGSITVACQMQTSGAHWLSASSTTLQSGHAAVYVNAGNAAVLQLGGVPNPTVTGRLLTGTVTALDAYGNVAVDYTGSIQFSSSDANAVLPQAYAFAPADAGVHVFANSMSFSVAGLQWLQISDVQQSQLVTRLSNIEVDAICHGLGDSLNLTGIYVDAESYYPPDLALSSAQQPVVSLYDPDDEVLGGYYPQGNIYTLPWTGSTWNLDHVDWQSIEPNGSTYTYDTEAMVLTSANTPMFAWLLEDSNNNGFVFVATLQNGAANALGTSMTGNGVFSSVGSDGGGVGLVLDANGQPVVSASLAVDGNMQLAVRHWDGSNWVPYGSSEIVTQGITDNYFVSLVLNSTGNPVVAYVQYAANGNSDLLVAAYDGTAWGPLGNSQASGGLSASGVVFDGSLAAGSQGQLAVAWSENYQDIYVKSWNGTAWVELSGSSEPGGISQNAGSSYGPILTYDSANALSVVWNDDSERPGYPQAFLRRYGNNAWTPDAANFNALDISHATGTANVSVDQILSDAQQHVYVVWQVSDYPVYTVVQLCDWY